MVGYTLLLVVVCAEVVTNKHVPRVARLLTETAPGSSQLDSETDQKLAKSSAKENLKDKIEDEDEEYDQVMIKLEMDAGQKQDRVTELSTPQERKKVIEREMKTEGDLNLVNIAGHKKQTSRRFPIEQLLVVSMFILGGVSVIFAFNYCKRSRPGKH